MHGGVFHGLVCLRLILCIVTNHVDSKIVRFAPDSGRVWDEECRSGYKPMHVVRPDPVFMRRSGLMRSFFLYKDKIGFPTGAGAYDPVRSGAWGLMLHSLYKQDQSVRIDSHAPIGAIHLTGVQADARGPIRTALSVPPIANRTHNLEAPRKYAPDLLSLL